MNTRILANPFFCYIMSFGLSLFIYSWGWSEIYPSLTVDVVLFLLSTFVISLLLGKKISYKVNYREIRHNGNSIIIFIVIMCCYLIEFIYNKGVPLYLILRGSGDVDYMEFGIPTFHVILHTFSSFFTVYLFHQYISVKNQKQFVMVVTMFIPNILIVNRGAIIMTLTACLIVYLFSIKKVILKKIITLSILLVVFFYGFGYLGNSRSFNGDSYAFLRLTNATDVFTESNIPKEFYWFYIYASSPFANFQNAVMTSVKHRYDVVTFFTWELLPDFISKRIVQADADFDGSNRLDYSINPILTVGSLYFEPYIRMGWAGPIVVFFVYALFVFLYITLLPIESKYFVTALSIMCVISFFNVFENMINFSGLSFQLVYPLLMNYISRFKFVGFRIPVIKIRL